LWWIKFIISVATLNVDHILRSLWCRQYLAMTLSSHYVLNALCQLQQNKIVRSILYGNVGISTKYPRFLGDGYLALSAQQCRFDQLTATIICRPETNNGLLLLNTDTIDARHDFFSVALVDGRVVFTYVLSII